jgi:hypothetical protein
MKVTQCERILRHLRDYGSITSGEAISEYGIYRLASRINDLKVRGYRFETEIKTGKNRYGEPTHWNVYRLAEGVTANGSML